MKQSYTATAEITIKTSAARVWQALTDPQLIKQYLFGTEASSDWKVGSPITYRGLWQGKRYEDKGTVLEAIPNRLLKATYWSSMGGLPDEPEYYNTVTYELSEQAGETTLRLTQDNSPTAEDAEHATGNWRLVLQGLKELLER